MEAKSMYTKRWSAFVAIICVSLASPVLAAHSGSAPIDPPERDDVVFTVDVDSGLDTGCTYRSGGPLRIKLPIDRYIGEVNPDGTLADPGLLKAANIISGKARLRMPAFDVDSSTSLPSPRASEVDKVFFNGHDLSKPLTGVDNQWIMNNLEVPIEWIKFPQRGSPGTKPVAVENEIRIDIDTANTSIGEQVWCTSIDWAALEFKAMAPLLLVHGTNAQSDTWQPPTSPITTTLETLKIPFDHRINLVANGSVDGNARLLAGRVRDLALSFGVKKVHIVAHSKGGLDARRYLSTYYNPDEVRVLSLQTLSTAHHGIVLADIMIVRDTVEEAESADEDLNDFLDLEWYRNNLSSAGPQRPAIDEQQTATAAAFNAANPLPAGVRFWTYGADADVNNDGRITDAEAAGSGIPSGFPTYAAQISHRILRNVSNVTVTYRTNFFGLNEWDEVSPVATTTPQDNDLVVTDRSAHHPRAISHTGPLDRNHSTIKDGTTIDAVLAKIRSAFPVN
jgi:triacylglycerol lipase